MYITNENIQNYSFYSLQLEVKLLDTQLNEPTNQISRKDYKVVKPKNKKTAQCHLGCISILNYATHIQSIFHL